MTDHESAVVDILLVDDDVSFRDILAQQLRQAGYATDIAPNGRVAISRLAQRRYRLVVTDLFMPEGDGIEVLLALRNRQIPVITISGSMSFDPGLFDRIALQFGAFQTLWKPFGLEQLFTAIRSAIGEPRERAP